MWKKDMAAMIENILNEDIYEATRMGHSYEVTIDTDSTFKVERNGILVYNCETIEHLPSHWKRFAEETIIKIYRQKIRTYLEKL